ncbi:MAG: type III pantothenate kinase [Lachnospiraceae bacterium]|nr:type III pantothenate kinase [Lachnospiraceae bacterium]
MLLVIDVGNTNITLGIFKKEKLLATFRMTTKQSRTSDEFGILMRLMIQERGLDKDDVHDVIISSVVPDVMYSLNSAIIKYFKTKPLIVGPGIKSGIRIVTDNPKEIGADRIVDVAAGYTLYGGPVLVIDFGTATTYDLVDEKGAFIAGITSPGIEISARALWQDAAKLPKIAIEKPKSILAKETITSMQAGLVYGYIGQTEYIIDKVKEESGLSNLKVVATGGLGKIIADETNRIDIYDNMLTLKGLRIIYEKNR